MGGARILFNLFHPNLSGSRANRVIAETVADLSGLTINNLYRKYPDGKIDVVREQALLVGNDIIVWQHPFYWYSGPSLLKEYLDAVFLMNFAYPPGVGNALRGKIWQTSTTAGGPVESYQHGAFNNFTIEELLAPFCQTANLSQMRWQIPLVLHSVLPPGVAGFRNVSEEDILAHARSVRAHLAKLAEGWQAPA